MRRLILIPIAALSFSLACVEEPADRTAPVVAAAETAPTAAPAPVPAASGRQMLIAMVGDDSLSTVTTLVPRPLPVDIERLLAIVRRRGGDFGWTSVCADSRRPMLRVHLETAPAIEPEPALPENAFLREAAEIDATAIRQRNTDRHRQWQERTDAIVAGFMAEMRRRLSAPATCGKSDVFGAVARALLMLNEPAADGRAATALPVLLVASDGDDTVGRRRVQIPDTVHTVIVNGTGTRGDLQVPNAVAFEALDPSIRHLEQLSSSEE